MEKCFEKNFNVGRYEYYKYIYENKIVLKFKRYGVITKFVTCKLEAFKDEYTPNFRLRITFIEIKDFKTLYSKRYMK